MKSFIGCSACRQWSGVSNKMAFTGKQSDRCSEMDDLLPSAAKHPFRTGKVCLKMSRKSKLDKMYILSNLYDMVKAHRSASIERSLGYDLLPQLSSTELKSNTGEVLRQAAKGAIAITRHNRTEFVILPAAQYEELVSQSSSALASMSDEFDSLVARMNTPAAAKGFKSLFTARSQELGKAAVTAAKSHAR